MDPRRSTSFSVTGDRDSTVKGKDRNSGETETRATTLLVNNIHCASCVSHIREVIFALRPPPFDVSVNILSHKVAVQHIPALAPIDIATQLLRAAFEIDSAITDDGHGNTVSEIDLTTAAREGWLEQAADRWSKRTSHAPRQSASSPALNASLRAQRKKHIENCAACQADEITPPEKPGLAYLPPTSLSKHRQWGARALRHSMPLNGEEKGLIVSPSKKTLGSVTDSSISLPELAFKRDPSYVAPWYQPEEPTAWKADLSIGGMTCASCVTAITLGVKELPIVHEANVTLMTNSATFVFDAPQENVNKIIDKIDELGFESSVEACSSLFTGPPAAATSSPQRFVAHLSIGGMTCSSCISSLSSGLHELPYVKSAEINLLSNSGRVIFEEREQLDSVIQKVEDLGYECHLESLSIVHGAENQDSQPDAADKTRNVSIKIDGMFCALCPPKTTSILESKFGDRVKIEQAPTLKQPILKIEYQPQLPDFTIRHIMASLEIPEDVFKPSIHHPPSIEERSRVMQVHEQRRLLVRLIICVVMAIPTFLIGVVWTSLVPSTNSLRVFLEAPMWSGIVPRSQWALLFLSTPVMFFAADVFHRRALKEIYALWRRRSTTPILKRFYRFGSMNLLMSAGTSVAYLSSIAMLAINATTQPDPKNHHDAITTTYFDSVVFLTMFILMGRYLEAYSKRKTGDAVMGLGKLRPAEALLVTPQLVRDDSEKSMESAQTRETVTQTISVHLLERGDLVVVPHGSSPPTDGVIVSGATQFDESSLTGESHVINKDVGDAVFAGTINRGNVISVNVTGAAGRSMLDHIVRVVREGQTKRAPVERIADRITAYFVPVITLIAIVTFVIWVGLGQGGVLQNGWQVSATGGWTFWALQFAIAVFVVACPCGIGLAAPTALFVGSGLAAQHGILVRGGGEAFQEASSVDAVVFDKTGTLTEGSSPAVTDHDIFSTDPEGQELTWAIASALEEASSHPIARAIASFCLQKPRFPISAESIQERPGLGLCGVFTLRREDEEMRYEAAIGSEAYIETLRPAIKLSCNDELRTKWKAEGKSIALLAVRCVSSTTSPSTYTIAASFAATTPLRLSALPTISTLKSMGLAVYMLTGDNTTTAQAVAASVGISSENVFAGVLPADKAARIRWLQVHAPRRGSPASFVPADFDGDVEAQAGVEPGAKQKRRIAYCGDGVNDAPALAATPISISLSSGTDIAVSSSSFILLNSDLSSLLTLFALSRKVFNRVKMNFAWALVYNAAMVPLAAGVFFAAGNSHWRLSPVWASAAMAASSVSVVCSSLALRSKIPGLGFRERAV